MPRARIGAGDGGFAHRRAGAEAGKPGTPQVNYGLRTDARGCPVAVSVHQGNPADSRSFMPALHKLRESDGIGWITALKSSSICALIEQGQVQMDLFDERNLLELNSPDYPGERRVACRNEVLAGLRAHKREALLAATERNLAKIKERVVAGKLAGRDAIGLRVGKLINQYKVAKHFEPTIADAALSWARKQDRFVSEAALDGVDIIRTSVPATQMDAPQCVRNYKSLANVERAFRSIKKVDLKVRPIHHRTANRVRAQIFLCMLTSVRLN